MTVEGLKVNSGSKKWGSDPLIQLNICFLFYRWKKYKFRQTPSCYHLIKRPYNCKKTFKKVKHNYFNKIKDGRGAKSNRSQAHPHPDSHALPYRWNLSTRQSVNQLTNNQPVIHPSNQTLDLSEHDMSHTMHVITELHRAPSRPVTNRSTPPHYSTTLHHTTLPPT